MRKVMLGLVLAAGAALPTLANAESMAMQDRPPEGERHHGGPGGERPHEQGARAEQPRPAALGAGEPMRPQPAPQAQPQAQARAQVQTRADGRGGGTRWGGDIGTRVGGNRVQSDERARIGQDDQRHGDDAMRAPAPGLRPDRGPQGNAFGYRGRSAPPPQAQGYRGQDGYRADAYGRTPQYRSAPGQYRAQGNWNRGWRGDRRYDWGGYRTENRGAFHLPRYDAPRGWSYGYRRFSPGLTLSALLFDEEYWIDDAYDYRLPPAYGPYRWVRYYNDALLVDIRTGLVVDTVYDIFW